MKHNLNNLIIGTSIGLMLPLASASAATLVEVNFSGTGAGSPIAAADAQFTIKNSVVTFDDVTDTLNIIGGGASTGGWNYDGTGTAMANTDLHTGSTFGAPTRFDLDLGVAASGQSYTITSVELDIRASNSAGTTWEFGYRDSSNATQLIGAQTISIQSGADPIATYSIDLTAENLTATDTTTAWNTGGTGELRWAFYEPTGTGNDNFQVAGIRVIGTVVPEPSSTALLGLGSLALILRRRR